MKSDQPHSKSKRLAELLDSKFKIPGTNIRFGLDPILGLLPGIGDWVASLASLYILFQGAKQEARVSILFRMLINILLDLVIGTIPVLGELFDVGWKANLRNAELLDDLEQDPEKTKKQSKVIVWSFCLISVVLVFGLLYFIGWLLIALIGIIL